jgi:hypothetical protein
VWHVRSGDAVEAVATPLRLAIERLLPELDTIDGLAAYHSHRWFNRFRPRQENAQVLYALGDVEGARQEVQALAELFSDREAANCPEWWIETLHLASLTKPAESG